jgi:hypothetical protein
MPELFNSNSNNVGLHTVKAKDMLLTVQGANTTASGNLIQTIVLSYTQPVQTLREIGSKNYYYFSFPTSGVLNIGQIIAGSKSLFDLFPNDGSTNIWSVPKHGGMNPSIEIASPDHPNIKYTLRQCIVSNLALNMNADGRFVQRNLVINFKNLTVPS